MPAGVELCPTTCPSRVRRRVWDQSRPTAFPPGVIASPWLLSPRGGDRPATSSTHQRQIPAWMR
jgi:hypothetical protein